MSQNSLRKTLFIAGQITLTAIVSAAGATVQSDTIRHQFFDTLATTLRADYRLCTADSTEKPVSFLLTWRATIDSIAASPAYPDILRKFTGETGINGADARPCEIVAWMAADARRREESAQLLAAERDRLIEKHTDSLYLAGELLKVNQLGCDIAGIPFGLPLRALQLFAGTHGITLTINPAGSVIIDPIIIGNVPFRAALHLSKEDRYTWYEMESATCGSDSLDSWARPIADHLAADMEARTSLPPAHVYRVGRFDIVPGRLAICKLWELSDAFVYTGLARTGNRFYAKTIVQRK